MTPDERNLIMGLFDRMRTFGTVEKEREADTLINAQVRQIPDSAYLLVQSVLVQEQVLSAANDRVQQLEARVRDLEQAAPRATAAASSGGSFLGGLFGGSKAAQPTSVPLTRSAPAGGPWGQPAQPQYQQPPVQQGYNQGMPMQAAPAPRAGGGFLGQAMTTAAGVAGGMLAANAISNMLGGGHHGQNRDASNAGYDQAAMNRAQDEAQDQEAALQDDSNDPGNDPGTSAASNDGGGWGGGGDSDSSDA